MILKHAIEDELFRKNLVIEAIEQLKLGKVQAAKYLLCIFEDAESAALEKILLSKTFQSITTCNECLGDFRSCLCAESAALKKWLSERKQPIPESYTEYNHHQPMRNFKPCGYRTGK